MTCSACNDPSKKLFARGLCQACYYRLRRRGTTERKNVRNDGRKCLVDGCNEVAVAKGLCAYHYNKLQHPLYSIWRMLRTRAGEGNYPAEWDDMEQFLAAVGERPTPDHQLRRHDTSKPHGKENTFWLAPLHTGSTDATNYAQAWNLQRKFGLSAGAYAAKLAAQNGVCAGCKQKETRLGRRTGKPQALAVDHDHKTGALRGLLCFRCNATLGMVSDDVAVLEALASYVKSHAPPD